MSDGSAFYQLQQTGITSDSYLGSVFEIEEVLLSIHDLSEKIDHLKGLKAHRLQKINDEISKFENRTEELRKLILNTMSHHNPKTKKLDFPDVGSVTKRTSKASWEIQDDSQVVDFFKKEGLENDVMVPQKPRLDKRKAKTLVQEYQKKGTQVPGTVLKDAEESLSISFEKQVKEHDEPVPDSVPVGKINVDDLESLEV